MSLAVVEYLRIVAAVSRGIANEDTALLWYTAREWGHLRIHQPNAFGQAYGTTVEAIPIELLRAAGVSLSTATPLVLGALSLAGWFLLAWAATRRRHPLLAATALAVPVLLSAYHTVYLTSVWTTPVLRMAALAGAALLISKPRSAVAVASAAGLTGLAIVMDPSTLLLTLPVGAWYVFDSRPGRSELLALSSGAVAPVAWLLGSRWFYASHPDYDLHGGLSTQPSWTILRHSLAHPDHVFRLYAPELLRSWVVAVGVLVVLVAMLIASRRVQYVLPAALVSLLILGAMATPKASIDAGPFLPSGRLVLLLPASMWFLALLVAEAGVARVFRPGLGQAAYMVIIVLAVFCTGIRTIDSDGRVQALRKSALNQGFGNFRFDDVGRVVAQCADVTGLMDSARTKLAVFLSSFTRPYACSALHDGRIETLFVAYERRTWRLYEELATLRTSAALYGVHKGFCAFAQRRVESCEAHGDAAVLRFGPRSILDVLASLGIETRAFGRHCHISPSSPVDVAVHRRFSVCRSGVDESLRLPRRRGAAPIEQVARAEIASAYRQMLDARDPPKTAVEHEPVDDLILAQFTAAFRTQQPPMVRVDRVRFVDQRFAVVRFALVNPRGKRPLEGRATQGPLSTIVRRELPLTGQAILLGGRWQVARPTFCHVAGLLGAGCQPLND